MCCPPPPPLSPPKRPSCVVRYLVSCPLPSPTAHRITAFMDCCIVTGACYALGLGLQSIFRDRLSLGRTTTCAMMGIFVALWVGAPKKCQVALGLMDTSLTFFFCMLCA